MNKDAPLRAPPVPQTTPSARTVSVLPDPEVEAGMLVSDLLMLARHPRPFQNEKARDYIDVLLRGAIASRV
jgi:hypothetical protein